MVQTRSSTRRNSIQASNQSTHQLNSNIDSQLINTMHVVRPSTSESSSGNSNISSPPGYQENRDQIILNNINESNTNESITNESNINESNTDENNNELPSYNESQYLLHNQNSESLRFVYFNTNNFKRKKTHIFNYEINYIFNEYEFLKFIKFRGLINILIVINCVLLFVFINNNLYKDYNNLSTHDCYLNINNNNNSNSNDSSNKLDKSQESNYNSLYLFSIIISIVSILVSTITCGSLINVDSLVAVIKTNILNLTKKFYNSMIFCYGILLTFLMANLFLLFYIDYQCNLFYNILINFIILIGIIYCFYLINYDLRQHILITEIRNIQENSSENCNECHNEIPNESIDENINENNNENNDEFERERIYVNNNQESESLLPEQ